MKIDELIHNTLEEVYQEIEKSLTEQIALQIKRGKNRLILTTVSSTNKDYSHSKDAKYQLLYHKDNDPTEIKRCDDTYDRIKIVAERMCITDISEELKEFKASTEEPSRFLGKTTIKERRSTEYYKQLILKW